MRSVMELDVGDDESVRVLFEFSRVEVIKNCFVYGYEIKVIEAITADGQLIKDKETMEIIKQIVEKVYRMEVTK